MFNRIRGFIGNAISKHYGKMLFALAVVAVAAFVLAIAFPPAIPFVAGLALPIVGTKIFAGILALGTVAAQAGVFAGIATGAALIGVSAVATASMVAGLAADASVSTAKAIGNGLVAAFNFATFNIIPKRRAAAIVNQSINEAITRVNAFATTTPVTAEIRQDMDMLKVLPPARIGAVADAHIKAIELADAQRQGLWAQQQFLNSKEQIIRKFAPQPITSADVEAAKFIQDNAVSYTPGIVQVAAQVIDKAQKLQAAKCIVAQNDGALTDDATKSAHKLIKAGAGAVNDANIFFKASRIVEAVEQNAQRQAMQQ